MAETRDTDIKAVDTRDKTTSRGGGRPVADKGTGAPEDRRGAPDYPADKRPTTPEAIERSDLPERDKQYGSDDN